MYCICRSVCRLMVRRRDFARAIACMTGARGERDISRGARHERKARDEGKRKIKRRFIFLFLSSRALCSCSAPREISRSPRLAHKAPVMQATRACKGISLAGGLGFGGRESRAKTSDAAAGEPRQFSLPSPHFTAASPLVLSPPIKTASYAGYGLAGVHRI